MLKNDKWWKDLKKGDYVVAIKQGGAAILNYIYKVDYIDSDGWITCFQPKCDSNGHKYVYYRIATPEEIKMYEHAGKPVDVTTYKIAEIIPEVIPEYVECTVSTTNEFTLGKIYKLEYGKIRTNKGYLPDILYKSGEKYYSYYFKPSTKEAYEAQFKLKEMEKPEFEVGKWYNCSDIYWSKFKEIRSDKWWESESIHIRSKQYSNRLDWRGIKNNWKEVDISEIQQYLPDGHVDKIEKDSSWCVVITEENRKVAMNYFTDFKGNSFYSGSKYGVNKDGKQGYINREGTCSVKLSTKTPVISTEEFYKKIRYMKEEEFVLPEKWCVKDEGQKELGNYFNSQSGNNCYPFGNGYLHSHNCIGESIVNKNKLKTSFHDYKSKDSYTEITFDQFKKYVLKEEVKNVEKWAVGTWVVAIKGNFGTFSDSNKLNIGEMFSITRNSKNSVEVKDSIYWIYKDNLAWFATKEEAEKFARTLVSEPEKDTMKKAVYCKNQQEWDFVAKKLRRIDDTGYRVCGDCIEIKNSNSSHMKGKHSEYVDISFKEWCKDEGIENPFTKKPDSKVRYNPNEWGWEVVNPCAEIAANYIAGVDVVERPLEWTVSVYKEEYPFTPEETPKPNVISPIKLKLKQKSKLIISSKEIKVSNSHLKNNVKKIKL